MSENKDSTTFEQLNPNRRIYVLHSQYVTPSGDSYGTQQTISVPVFCDLIKLSPDKEFGDDNTLLAVRYLINQLTEKHLSPKQITYKISILEEDYSELMRFEVFPHVSKSMVDFEHLRMQRNEPSEVVHA